MRVTRSASSKVMPLESLARRRVSPSGDISTSCICTPEVYERLTTARQPPRVRKEEGERRKLSRALDGKGYCLTVDLLLLGRGAGGRRAIHEFAGQRLLPHVIAVLREDVAQPLPALVVGDDAVRYLEAGGFAQVLDAVHQLAGEAFVGQLGRDRCVQPDGVSGVVLGENAVLRQQRQQVFVALVGVLELL